MLRDAVEGQEADKVENRRRVMQVEKSGRGEIPQLEERVILKYGNDTDKWDVETVLSEYHVACWISGSLLPLQLHIQIPRIIPPPSAHGESSLPPQSLFCHQSQMKRPIQHPLALKQNEKNLASL